MKPRQLRTITTLGYATIALNVFDIILHVAIGQPEALRITANVVVIIVSVVALIDWRRKLVLSTGLALHLLLNGVFVIMHGIGNLGILLITLTALLLLVPVLVSRTKI